MLVWAENKFFFFFLGLGFIWYDKWTVKKKLDMVVEAAHRLLSVGDGRLQKLLIIRIFLNFVVHQNLCADFFFLLL